MFTQVSYTIHHQAGKGPDVPARTDLDAFGCFININTLTAANLPLYIKELEVTLTALHPATEERLDL